MWYEETLIVYLSYTQTFGWPLPSINKSKKKRDRDELYRWWWIGPNLIDFFGGPSEKTNHLINDEKINIDRCYFIYQIIYYYVLYLHLIFLLLFTSCLVLLVIYEIHVLFGLKMNEDDVCLVDYAATHTILRDKIYLLKLTLIKANISTISITTNLV